MNHVTASEKSQFGADTFRELMNRYDEKRAEWIARFGSDAGFDAWFTKQAIGR